MVSFKFAAFAVAAFSAVNVIAAEDTETVKVEQVVPEGSPDIGSVQMEDMGKYAETGDKQWADKRNELPLSVEVKVTFPDAEIFGVKLVNGRPTRALLHVTNNEEVPINTLVAIGALLSPSGKPGAPDPPVAMRNLTGTKFDALVQPKSTETFTYAFATVMNPQDVTLEIKTVISRGPRVFTLTAFSESVSVVEAPVSIFDPQIIFLYTFLLAAFGGVCYFIYNTWISTLFPQKKRGGKGGERAKRSSGGSKPVDPSEQVPVLDADGPAVTTGSKGYDESWIPATHLSRPQAKRVGSGRPKSRAA